MSVSHGFTVQRTGDDALDRLQQRIKQALDTVVASATGSQLTNKTQYTLVGAQDLQNSARGADTPSNAIIQAASEYQHLTGVATVNFMLASTFFDGARVEFYIVNGLTFNHHAVGGNARFLLPLHLLSGAATAKAAGSVIAFRRDDSLGTVGYWVQVA